MPQRQRHQTGGSLEMAAARRKRKPGARRVPDHCGTPVTGRTMWDAFAEVAAGRAYVMVVLVAAWRCRWFASLGAVWAIVTYGPKLLHRMLH